MEYDIINGTPALKANAKLSRFQSAGGTVEWLEYTDECVSGKFSHPSGGTVVVTWDNDRVKQAELGKNSMHKKFPRQMKRARCISEAIETILPGVSHMYTPEEVMDMEPRNITSEVDVKPAAKPNTKQTAKPVAEPNTKPAAKPAAEPKPVKQVADGETDAAKKIKAAQEAAKKRAAINVPCEEVPEPQTEEPETVNNNKEPEPETPSDEDGLEIRPIGGFDIPSGDKASDEKLNAIETQLSNYGISMRMVECWRGLACSEWTESVVAEIRELFKEIKNGRLNREQLLDIIKA